MALLRVSSPHAHGPGSTARLMRLVILATLPAFLTLSFFFGWGTLINLVWASLIALGCEAAVLKLRKRPLAFYLSDNSALLTAVLLALALPPLAPWWLTLIGVAFAILVGKHLYGGMGYNPFNPAMLGYVLLLISFPVQMSAWAAPAGVEGAIGVEGFSAAFKTIFPLFGDPLPVDAYTLATPLELMRENKSLTLDELWALHPVLWGLGGQGWIWVNLAFLAGGLFLLNQRVFTWHAPLSMLIALSLMSLFFYGGDDSSSKGSTAFHLLSGATMMGAFFIATDPVTSAVSSRGRILYGAGIGILVYVIRSWGGYPDGVAFAVLLMNMAAPTIDYYTQPRTYGHKKPNKGLAKPD
ncbi:electron transport complex subunit RsxD [Aestuariirhabdus litorea]|uniref:Ion-translocating oxidoreductase complex subunit D n=1 Tax=Aestuariirhabdus litorea TaxID=2528527 RepID=A0A3P3VUK6_9GAMM|nr:electron transport complex subunit RsxD [Aestuariirhabdus litorea]RRJ85129.1 electron transport complex subunit RsxD [Aestuariirhabdus litorea]RWW98353.1 electron transport complex subunit RsxD [Endozoicomonadaceae bacterium GTF-13]